MFIVKIHDPDSEFGRMNKEKSEPIWGHILQSALLISKRIEMKLDAFRAMFSKPRQLISHPIYRNCCFEEIGKQQANLQTLSYLLSYLFSIISKETPFKHLFFKSIRRSTKMTSQKGSNRAFQSIVFNSRQKMAFREFYFTRALTKALTYYYINRSQHHLLAAIENN